MAVTAATPLPYVAVTVCGPGDVGVQVAATHAPSGAIVKVVRGVTVPRLAPPAARAIAV